MRRIRRPTIFSSEEPIAEASCEEAFFVQKRLATSSEQSRYHLAALLALLVVAAFDCYFNILQCGKRGVREREGQGERECGRERDR